MTSAKKRLGWLALPTLLLATVALGAAGCVADAGNGDDIDPPMPSPSPSSSPTPIFTPDPTPSGGPEPLGDNVLKITVNGSLCKGTGKQYPNEPCVQITLCSPTTGECQEPIDNILLDTGSYGLRIYSSLVKVPLTQAPSGTGGELAECIQFGDGSSEWGPVKYARVKLGNQPSVKVPIHLINSTYSRPPAQCSSAQGTPDTGPSQTGFKGILGVGMLTADCGSACARDAANNMYYSCNSAGCVPTTVAVGDQVQNPVSLLPRDNNGVIVRLPAVDPSGAASVDGTLTLGIGTQPNNQPPSTLTTYGADEYANFTTVFSNYSADPVSSFIDSGSSVMFFPPPPGNAIPDCYSPEGGMHGRGYSGFYCPASTLSLSATNFSATSSVNGAVPFQVGNAFSLFQSGNMVFPTMADASASGLGTVFDWGLPFFFGRDVYVGFEGKSSPLSKEGRYWAY